MREYDLSAPLSDLCNNGFPMMGTCAGMILLARKPANINGIQPLEAMDIEVRRNAFGRQVDSFESELKIPVIGEPSFHGVFIRAPYIERAGEGVEVLARLHNGTGVAARQGNMLALAFHPELTDDPRLHSYFLSIVNGDATR
jgi:5'-phosphate synthase pdxT subunit